MEIEIKRLAFGGHGLGHAKDKAIFVPYALPGEKALIEITKEKSSFAFGKVKSILNPSPSRTSPLCPHFQTCGGCQFQHYAYEKELEAKEAFVIESLKHIGGISFKPEKVFPALHPYSYRKHIRLNLRRIQGKTLMGYIDENQNLLPIKLCPIFSTDPDLFLKISELIDQLDIGEGSLRIFNEAKPLLAFSLPRAIPKTHPLAKRWLTLFAGIHFKSPKQKITYGQKHATWNIDDLSFDFSPYGFMQNHLSLAERLYKTVIDALDSAGSFLDLYCGAGVLSILAAKKGCMVRGIESSKESYEAACHNAKQNRVDPAFYHKKAEESLSLIQGFSPGLIYLNPPREGLSAKVRNILLEAQPSRLIYSSCMPSTLARDLKELIKSRYKIERGFLFDFFPRTTHIEAMVELSLQPSL